MQILTKNVGSIGILQTVFVLFAGVVHVARASGQQQLDGLLVELGVGHVPRALVLYAETY